MQVTELWLWKETQYNNIFKSGLSPLKLIADSSVPALTVEHLPEIYGFWNLRAKLFISPVPCPELLRTQLLCACTA